MINGVRVKIYYWNLTDLLPVNEPMLLFLRYNPDIGKYEIYSGGAYAVNLIGGRTLRARVKGAPMDPILSGTDVEQAIARINDLRR